MQRSTLTRSRVIAAAASLVCLGVGIGSTLSASAEPSAQPAGASAALPESSVADNPPPDSQFHKNVTDANADAIIASSKERPVVMVWGNHMCHGCHELRDVVVKMAGERRDFLSTYADTKKAPNLKAKYKIELQPCTLFFSDNEEKHRFVAYSDEQASRKRINGILDKLLGKEPSPSPTPSPSPSATAISLPGQAVADDYTLKCY